MKIRVMSDNMRPLAGKFIPAEFVEDGNKLVIRKKIICQF